MNQPRLKKKSPQKRPPLIKPTQKTLEKIYRILRKKFGPQHWWPAKTPFEVIVGAILTQNTNWGNVKKAIRNLKKQNVLFPQALKDIPVENLAALIKPAGYFNVKAKRLKNFIRFFFEKYDGDLKKMEQEPLEALRVKLLTVNGIGPETADSILLYALNKPIFVVDAYTKRIFCRNNLIAENSVYHDIQKMFMSRLENYTRLFNEYHALIVRLGKDHCRPRPLCESCPLNKECPKFMGGVTFS